MGKGLIGIYKNKIKHEWKLAFIATFILGFLIHTYLFTNNLLNHDALYNYYSSQNIVGSGRWFLSVACGFSSYFNLPWLIGVISITFIALTAVIIVDIFKAKNPILIIIIGGLLVSFPSITNTFFYEFTADGYMIAMFLAALSVRLCLFNQKRIICLIASAVCLCLTCAIYQAYVSFALVLAIAYLIAELLEGRRTNRQCLKWITNQIIIYAAAMISYYAIWKLCMYLEHFEATSYSGIDKIGQMSIGGIIDAVCYTILNLGQFFMERDVFKYGFSLWNVFNIIFLIFAAIVVISALKKSGVFKRKMQLIIGIIAAAAIPFAIYIWLFASADVAYGTRMEQSICIIYILIAVLAERWLSVKMSTLTGMILAVFIFINGVNANVFYYYMHRCNQQSYAQAVEMAARIHELDDGTITRIAISGSMNGWESEDLFDCSKLGSLGALKSVNKSLLNGQKSVCLYLENEIGFELSYYTMNKDAIPCMEKESTEPVTDDWKFKFPVVSSAELEEIEATEEYEAMPCWPADGSVSVIGDVAVVKLQSALD